MWAGSLGKVQLSRTGIFQLRVQGLENLMAEGGWREAGGAL